MVDFWAFSTEEGEWGREIMSMHHTRNALQRLTPRVGPRWSAPVLACQACRPELVEPVARIHTFLLCLIASLLDQLRAQHPPAQCICGGALSS